MRVMVIALTAFLSPSSPLTSSQPISRESFLINSTWSHHPWLTVSSEQGHSQVQLVPHLMTVHHHVLWALTEASIMSPLSLGSWAQGMALAVAGPNLD